MIYWPYTSTLTIFFHEFSGAAIPRDQENCLTHKNIKIIDLGQKDTSFSPYSNNNCIVGTYYTMWNAK